MSEGFSSISEYLSTEERMSIAKEFKLYRQSAGYTQRTFSELAEVCPPTVYHWENGFSLMSIMRACELHRKTKGACNIAMMRPDLIKFLREFKDVIDDLKI